MSSADVLEAPLRTLDQVVAGHAQRHDALQSELAALATVENNLAVADAHVHELRKELKATSTYISTARQSASRTARELDELKKRAKGGKLTRMVLMKGKMPPASELAVAEREHQDAQQQVAAMEVLAETTKFTLKEERDKVDNFSQLLLRHSEVEVELDSIYSHVFSGEGTVPDDRLLLAQQHISSAQEKLQAVSLREDPVMMASLLRQCEQIMGVPLHILLQADRDLEPLVQRIYRTVNSATPVSDAEQAPPDLSFIETEKDLRDYLHVVYQDARRVAKEATAARATLRQLLGQLFDDIRRQTSSGYDTREPGPSSSKAVAGSSSG